MMIWASTLIHGGRTCSPTEEGRALAEALIRGSWPKDGVILDLPAELMIRPFFDGFFSHMNELGRLDDARRIHWEIKFDFQRENLARWIWEFEPLHEPIFA